MTAGSAGTGPGTGPSAETIRQALAHERAGRVGEAVRLYQSVLARESRHALALHQLSGIAGADGDLHQAIGLMSLAIDADPGMATAYANLGHFLRDDGRIDEAIAAYRSALTLAPGFADAHRALLAALMYGPALDAELDADLDPAARFAAHRAFAAQQAPPPDQVLPPPTVDRDPQRRLRVGLLSSDLRAHAVARNLAPLFDRRDRAAWALIGYAEVAAPDPVTDVARQGCDDWRSTVGMTDRAVAELIRRDRIDILVVTAGRFDANRPLVACYRPAPLQVSLYDAATSGLDAFDYLLTDAVLSPPDAPEAGRELFTERLAYLPTLVTFPPLGPQPEGAPPVGALPALLRGAMSFGSFNNPAKLGRATVALWARVLAAVPTATLTLKFQMRYADRALRARLRGAFGAAGVDPRRLQFALPPDGRLATHLAAYGAIDIGLDPTPFPGVNTTYEALGMGVPVVTLAGDTMMARMSAGVLTAAGLAELVATSPDDYVARAVGLAHDLSRLAALRASLREQVARSALCDGAGFARSVDALWRTLWRDWCAHSP